MLESIIPTLTLLAALGSALMAGMFFTFSNFVMGALGRLPAAHGIAAMQHINVVILNPLFLIIFMGTALLALALPVTVLWRAALPNEAFLIGGSLCYLPGVMLVTITRNIPLNNALETLAADSAEASQFWHRFLTQWTRWNHVRAIMSFLATLGFILALT